MNSSKTNEISCRSPFGSETYEDSIASLFLKTKLLIEDEGLSLQPQPHLTIPPLSSFCLKPNSLCDTSCFQVFYQQGFPGFMHDTLF